MSVYGKIKEFNVITLEENLISSNDKALESYIRTKHKTAEDNNRYVVRFNVDDERFSNSDSIVNVFVPKGIIDNNLIEKNTYIECGSDSCHLKIVGIDAWFDRASNGATQIHDNK